VTITFACRDSERRAYEELADRFKAANPNIDVQLVSIDEVLDRGPAGGKEPEDTWRRLAAAADTAVFWVNEDITREGLVRDLSEFIIADKRFQPEDFYPNILESFQWDGGTWALPARVNLDLIFYDKDAFDAAGVAYPTLDWTWGDFLAKAKALTEREGEKVTRYGYVQPWGIEPFYLLEHADSLLDRSIDPPIPRLDRPDVARAAQWYIDLVELHQVTPYIPPHRGRSEARQLLENKRAAMWSGRSREGAQWMRLYNLGLAPYPSDGQGTTYFPMEGYVMSAGTLHPQESWRWLSFLTRQPPPGFGAPIPPRRSVAEATGYWDELDEEVARVYRYVLEHTQARVGHVDVVLDSFTEAVSAVLQGEKELHAALAEAQVQASERLSIRFREEERKPRVVATPQPERPLGPGDTIITFAYFGGLDIPRIKAYQELAERFNEDHPEVWVETQTPPEQIPPEMDDRPSNIAEAAERADCFAWYPYLLDHLADVRAAILSLDPFIDADPAFNLDDFHPLFVAHFRREGQLWGLPGEGWPRLIRYNKALFDAADVAYPTLDWTLDDFLVKAKALTHGEGDTKRYGFVPEEFELNDLWFFTYQQGGQLTDESTDPISFLFDTPAIVAGVQWYVNLSRVHGVKPVFGSGFSQPPETTTAPKGRSRLIWDGQAAMWTDYSRTRGFYQWAELETGVAPLPGNRDAGFVTVLGYFISAKTEAPGACWEWIVFLTEQLEPMQGVPARRSLVESAAYRQQVGEEAAAVYLASVERSEDSLFMKGQDWVSVPFLWFGQAYDGIMWDGVEVKAALAQVQAKADEYRACVAAGGGPGDKEIWKECATKVDPDIPIQLFD
jgi:multiple sugar transport system substrate-binding protein